MQSVQQIWRKNYRLWNQKEKSLIEDFYLTNKYFSTFYQNKKFDQISKICFYRKLSPGQSLPLQNNNRPEAIILLSGDIKINKKQRKFKKRPRIVKQSKQPNKQTHQVQDNFQYTYISHLKQFNDTIKLNSQSIIQCSQKTYSQILFVPCALFYKLQTDIQSQRVEKIQHVLQKFFFRLKKKELHQLSQSNCIFREFKMNNYIYRASSKPEEIYILLEGMIKLQKPGFSQQTMKQTILITAGRIFGQTDIKLQERLRNAVACSAHVQVLTIPKSSFLKFHATAFPDMIFQQHESISPQKMSSIPENLRISRSLKPQSSKRQSLLPHIKKSLHFHGFSQHMQSIKNQNQQRREYDLIKNSHMLVNVKQRPRRKFDIRNYSPKSKQQLESMIKKQKNNIKHLKVLSRFSLDDSLLDL